MVIPLFPHTNKSVDSEWPTILRLQLLHHICFHSDSITQKLDLLRLNGFQPFIIFARSSILDALLGSECSSGTRCKHSDNGKQTTALRLFLPKSLFLDTFSLLKFFSGVETK